MKTEKLFRGAETYESPRVKIAAMRIRHAILTISDPYNQDGLRNIGSDDVENQSEDWGF